MIILLLALSLVWLFACGDVEDPQCNDHVFSNDCDPDCNTEGCDYTREIEHVFSHGCDTECNTEGCGFTREVAHNFDNSCDTVCNTEGCGFTREAMHSYDHACDAECNVCAAARDISHVFSDVCDKECNTEGCGFERAVSHVFSHACDGVCNTEGCGFARDVSHVFSYDCDTECNTEGCGYTRVASHSFTNDCDTECDLGCGFVREVSHTYSHDCDTTCDTEGCGFTREVAHIYSFVCDALCDNPRCNQTRPVSHVFSFECDEECDTEGCTYKRAVTHTFDGEDDFECNVPGCGYIKDTGVALVIDGEPRFQIVLGDVGEAVRAKANELKAHLLSRGISVFVTDEGTAPKSCEILVGLVSDRGEKYAYDAHALGHEGYTVTAIDEKIVIAGGSDEASIRALELFISEFVGEGDEIENLFIEHERWVTVETENYPLEHISIRGTDLSEYNIASDLDEAELFRELLYIKSGYWLDIVPFAKAGQLSVIIRETEEAGELGFSAYVNGTRLMLDCINPELIHLAFDSFFDYVEGMGKTLAINASFTYERDVRYVYYSDFGVTGDGITDDYAAIRRAHEFANQYKLPVKGDKNATYRIVSTKTQSGSYSAIPIKTDTDWCGAKFIIDDTNVGWSPNLTGNTHEYNTNIFNVTNDYSNKTVYPSSNAYLKAINEAGGITFDTEKIDLGLGYAAMITVYDDSHKCYIRYGGNANTGAAKHELIVIDAEGNIDPSTPLLFEYSNISRIIVHRIDTEPITVENATFESLASRVNLFEYTNYYSARGINITRPNTTVRNLDHIITGEIPKNTVVDRESNIVPGYTYNTSKGKVVNNATGEYVTDGSLLPFIGHAFNGFINVHTTHNVYVEDVLFQGRTYYLQGTYDIIVTNANAVTFKSCRQSNFFTQKSGYNVPNSGGSPAWGVSGSNYCKNFVFDNCQLTRYDAHCGVVNGKIINSSVADITLIGGGEMLIENSTVYRGSGSVITLRADYGATFRGVVKLKNVSVIDCYENGNIGSIFNVQSANHWFGYTTYFPSVEIDNLYIRNAKSEIALVNALKSGSGTYSYRGVLDPKIHIKDAICADGKKNVNPYVPPEYVSIKNMEDADFVITVANVPFFDSTELSGTYLKK